MGIIIILHWFFPQDRPNLYPCLELNSKIYNNNSNKQMSLSHPTKNQFHKFGFKSRIFRENYREQIG